MNNKVMIGIIALVVFVGGVLFLKGFGTEQTLPPTTSNTVQDNNVAKSAAPVVTGKLDDIIAALDGEDAQEVSAAEAGNADVDTALSDEAIINDVTQSYDETVL